MINWQPLPPPRNDHYMILIESDDEPGELLHYFDIAKYKDGTWYNDWLDDHNWIIKYSEIS